MTIECCYNCKNYTEECLKHNYDKCDKYSDLIVFDDQPKRQLESPEIHND